MPQDQGTNIGTELAERIKMTKIAEEGMREPKAPAPAPTAPTAQPATAKAKARSIPAKGPYGAGSGEKRMDVQDWTKPLGSFKQGTDSVPKDGVYKLHEGEKVVPETKNPDSKKGEKMATPYDMVTGGKKPKKEIKEMVHSKSHNGKHIVTHKHHSPMHHPDEIHTFEDMKGVHDHMDTHDQGADGAAPMTAAPSPMEAAPAAGAAGAPAAPAM
jgi:hypothetical protein